MGDPRGTTRRTREVRGAGRDERPPVPPRGAAGAHAAVASAHPDQVVSLSEGRTTISLSGGRSPRRPRWQDRSPWTSSAGAGSSGTRLEGDRAQRIRTGSGGCAMTGTGRRPLNGRAGLKETSAETGWLAFAGVIMVLLGVSGSLQGFMCLFDQGYFLVSPAGLVVDVDYAAWGWTHLVLGLSIFAGGLGVLEGGTAVRRVAGGVAGVEAAGEKPVLAGPSPSWAPPISPPCFRPSPPLAGRACPP